MANVSNPLLYINKREYGLLHNLKSQLFHERLNASKNLYRRELVCHYGCVNAIEFSRNGELFVSGGDDRRVMLWQFGQAIWEHGKPEQMKAMHKSNIFCLAITSNNDWIYSGGNDGVVLVHDLECQCPIEVLEHQKGVCSLSIDPFNEHVVATAGHDGRLLLFDTRQSVHESLIIARSQKAFQGVMFHPQQVGMVVSANVREGVALWDLRSPKHSVIHYVGNNGSSQNSMSVRFNQTGTHILALRRRMAPVLYKTHSPEPLVEFHHQDYYNSCTMKSCCFAGDGDQFVLSGSDDFNLYMWKIPDTGGGCDMAVETPHLVLYSHRSIVNHVRYNPHYCIIASSGVEKIIKIWSGLEFPGMRGSLLQEAQGSDNPREMYSHEEYVSLVHRTGQYLLHNYAEQSTTEDPQMMAFFDALVQRELERLAAETDSLNGSSSGSGQRNGSDSSDSDHIVVDSLLLPPNRMTPNGNRSQRCPNRLARLVASRYQKHSPLRRNKQSRLCARKSRAGAEGSSASVRGKRPARRARGPRRQAPRRAAPSSGQTDSDEPVRPHYTNICTIVPPHRRRVNVTRSLKRINKVTSYRKVMNSRSNGRVMARDSSDNNNFSDLALPSTSTGYRGQSISALFRIAEVYSDDDQSVGSRPISPSNQNGNQGIPTNLVSIIPTPINGSRDSLSDSLRVEPPESESNNSSPPPESRLRTNLRRNRRNGRHNHHSDSSESPPPKVSTETNSSVTARLSPKVGYNWTVVRLMNETNESEMESSCSTESSLWLAPNTRAPDRGAATVAGSSSRNSQPADNVSDNLDYQAHKFRQRVKKARRNYRTHMDSDSN